MPTTFQEQLAAAERARHARLRRLWQMPPEQRVAAMRRGELTLEQLAAWSARHPEQVPMLNGEFEWIAIRTPEVCLRMTVRNPVAPRTPTRVRAISPAAELDAYLRTIAGRSPGTRLLEIRFALRHRDMGRVFVAAHSAPGAACARA